ncbi:MAG: TusE/DsrC/DsvC family sulfur relay protein [Gammaproteobacteria bacterium]|nr:TusE/DsrC/DsvC family sulfur relay protein [Gammaproteobacteria bacterium]
MQLQPNSLVTDNEGFLVDPEDWNNVVAEELARRENITLEPEHWEVLNFMRDYFVQHHIAADARFVIKFLNDKYGRGSGRDHLYRLFPYGYMQQACKVAGMRRPRAWSTG